jgi:transposase
MTWQPKQLTRSQREERRIEGGRLLLEGTLSQSEIARQLGVSPTAVCKWKQQLAGANNHLTSLASRPIPGGRGKLSEEQWQRILALLAQGASTVIAAATDRWTLGRVAQVIRQEYGISLSTVQIWYHLRRHGWSPQKPMPVAGQRDEARIAEWVKEDWPRIKKKP